MRCPCNQKARSQVDVEPKLLIQNVVDNLTSKHDMFPLQRAAAACSESFYCCVGFFNCREQMDREMTGKVSQTGRTLSTGNSRPSPGCLVRPKTSGSNVDSTL